MTALTYEVGLYSLTECVECNVTRVGGVHHLDQRLNLLSVRACVYVQQRMHKNIKVEDTLCAHNPNGNTSLSTFSTLWRQASIAFQAPDVYAFQTPNTQAHCQQYTPSTPPTMLSSTTQHDGLLAACVSTYNTPGILGCTHVKMCAIAYTSTIV